MEAEATGPTIDCDLELLLLLQQKQPRSATETNELAPLKKQLWRAEANLVEAVLLLLPLTCSRAAAEEVMAGEERVVSDDATPKVAAAPAMSGQLLVPQQQGCPAVRG